MLKYVIKANIGVFLVFSVLLIFDALRIVMDQKTLLMTSLSATLIGLTLSLAILLISWLTNKSIKKV